MLFPARVEDNLVVLHAKMSAAVYVDHSLIPPVVGAVAAWLRVNPAHGALALCLEGQGTRVVALNFSGGNRGSRLSHRVLFG